MKVSFIMRSTHQSKTGSTCAEPIFANLTKIKQRLERNPVSRPAQRRSPTEIRNAITELFCANQSELLAFLTRTTGNPAIAEEVAQEAYLRLLRYARMPEKGRERAYLFTTAARAAIDAIRLENRSSPMPRHHEIGEALLVQEAEGEPAAIFKEALETLPPRCRQVFLMHRIQGWRQTDIADMLDLSLSMVEKHVARGMRIMSQQLGKPACVRAKGKSR